MILIDEDTNNNVKEMTTKLLTYESKLLERDAEKKANKPDKGGYKQDETVICTYKPRAKKCHTEEVCRMKKRHQENHANKDSSNKDKSKPKDNPPELLAGESLARVRVRIKQLED